MSEPLTDLTFEQVVTHLADALCFDAAGCTPESGLYDDVGLQSMDAVELVLAVEGLAGCEAPLLDLPKLLTLGDVFSYYVALGSEASA